MESLIVQITIPGQMVFIYGRLIGEGIWPGHALSFWSFSSLSQLQMRPWVTSWLTQASYCEHRTAHATISLKAKLIPLTSDLTQATKLHSGMTLLGKKNITVSFLHMKMTVVPELWGLCHSTLKGSRLTDLTGKGSVLDMKHILFFYKTIHSSMTQLLNTQSSKRGV